MGSSTAAGVRCAVRVSAWESRRVHGGREVREAGCLDERLLYGLEHLSFLAFRRWLAARKSCSEALSVRVEFVL